jgi:glyceraldehyde-3-phosphate dehydrogenase (NADP+)
MAGEWLAGDRELEVRSPATGEVVGATFRPDDGGIERAAEEAATAFRETGRMPVHGKVEALKRIASGIGGRLGEFGDLIAKEAGKPIRIARKEVLRAVQTFTEAAEECSRIYGEIIPLDVAAAAEGRVGVTQLFPMGPVLAITPFNFPLNLVAHKLAPAIAAGCPVICKPSSETPLTALLLAEVIDGADLPRGALSVLPIDGERAEELAVRPEIRKVSFTGSAEVGWRLKQRAWNKRVTLELGGNAAVVLHEDWDDVEGAVDRIVLGGYAYAGQVCISVQRIYVHESLIDEFIGRFVEKVKALRVGDPLDESTDVGPMITESEARRVEAWVAEATDGGAAVLCGGKREGTFYQPTVLGDADPKMKVVREEVFGPVTAVFSYGEFDEALAAVNDSKFGLQAGVYTRDLGLARKAFGELEVGGVIVGDVPTFRVDRMPYGGVKHSGFGREGLRYAIREMCEPRLLVLAP